MPLFKVKDPNLTALHSNSFKANFSEISSEAIFFNPPAFDSEGNTIYGVSGFY